MSVDMNVCPVCTEYVRTPVGVGKQDSRGYQKYRCKRCGAEYKYKVTKAPDYNTKGEEE